MRSRPPPLYALLRIAAPPHLFALQYPREKMHVLVTGGCGFFGTWIIKVSKPWMRAFNPPLFDSVAIARLSLSSPAFSCTRSSRPFSSIPHPPLFPMQRLLTDGDSVTVFDVELFTKRWEMLMTPEEIAKVRRGGTTLDETDRA
jgi:hypothetical protein